MTHLCLKCWSRVEGVSCVASCWSCPDEGFLGELIRALSERLARLVGAGDMGVL